MKYTRDGLFSLNYLCHLLALLFLFACNPNTIHFNKISKPASVVAPSPLISNIQIINNQIVVTGTNLASIDVFAIKEGGSTTTPMVIESQSNTSLVANTISNVTFAAGKVFDFVFSNAYGASAFTVNFSLCDSDLNGKGFNCSITPNDKDVLSYDANTNKWVPRNVNGLSYKGAFSAAGGSDPGGTPANGDYYIISVAGTINTISYAIGDWIVYNADDSIWQKISNAKDVISVYGRTGKVSAKEGDYNLDKLSDVNTTTVPPTTDDVLTYNGTTWVPGSPSIVETDPLVKAFAKANLPVCGTGQVLKANGTTLSCVADGSFTGTANRVVTTNASGGLSISTISDTVLGYLSGLTSNVQTQLNLKADSSSIVDYSVAGLPLIYPTRVYGGSTQANKTLVTDGTGAITTSAITPTELGYLSGATSNIQNQLNTLSGAGLWVKTGSDLSYSSGKVGVGVTTPTEAFEVNGGVKVGATANSCTTSNKGTIRYNTISNVLEFCNGTSWNLLQAAACSDADPNVISFTDEVNATINTLYTSNIVQVSGINCSVPVTISGNGSPQFQICSDSSCSTVVQSWTSSPSTIVTGQYLQLRLTSDIAGGSPFKATVIIGSGATVWSVTTTGSCASSPTPGTVCADGTIYAGLSPDGSVPMYTTRCDSGQTWNGVSCTGSRLTMKWANGSNSTGTNVTNNNTGRTNTSQLVAATTNADYPFIPADYCDSLTSDGYTDWYLPSLNEMQILANNSGVIKNFTNSKYWTSTEWFPNSAYAINPVSAPTNWDYKNALLSIRCVRR